MTAETTTEAGAHPRLARSLPAPPIRIVHIGIGAFHRAHEAWYTSAVDAHGEWGIAGFTGRTPTVADELGPQGGLFTLVERGADGDTAEIVTSIVEVTDGRRVRRLVDLIAAADTAVVSLTVTESGYRLDADGRPDFEADDVRHDVEIGRTIASGSDADVDTARTALARLVLGLRARQIAGSPALAVMPCDNIPANGAWVATGVRSLAAAMFPGLDVWVDENVSFVSTSVDRITPRALEADRQTAQELTGFVDAGPVVTEPFHDWILSGSFPGGRPRWEAAGARFVDEIEPFERRKLWLLNGAHSLLAYLGRIRGHDTVAQAMDDPVCADAVEALWDEASAQLDADALGLTQYRAALRSRFANARIEHRLEQIGMEGAAKLRVRVAPVLLAERDAGRPGTAAATAVAAWVAAVRSGVDLVDAQSDAIASALSGPPEEVVPALLRVVDEALADPEVVALIEGVNVPHD